jgi:hypothetical protein
MEDKIVNDTAAWARAGGAARAEGGMGGPRRHRESLRLSFRSREGLIPVSLATAAITFFLVGSIVKAHRAPLQTGSEAMSGTPALAAEEFSPEDGYYRGLVRTHGELWKAVSQKPVAAGQELEVERREGLTLHVHPLSSPGVVTPIHQGQRKNIA